MRAALAYALSAALLLLGFVLIVEEARHRAGAPRGLLVVAAMVTCCAGSAHVGRAIRALRVVRARRLRGGV